MSAHEHAVFRHGWNQGLNHERQRCAEIVDSALRQIEDEPTEKGIHDNQ